MSWLLILCLLLFAAGLFLFVSLVRSRRHASAEIQRLNDAGTKLAEHAANYRLKLNALSQSSGAGIVMFDERSTPVHSNAIAESLLGLEPGGLVGSTVSADLQECVHLACDTQQPQTKDIQLPGAHSRILRANAFYFAQGLSGLPEVMLVLNDVTELRRLETIRRDFVANVSHELRTPLASIRAMAETLQDGALHDAEVSDRFLGTIVRETDRLARVAKDLLILSDAESKHPIRAWFDLRILLREVVGRSEVHAQDSSISLSLHANDHLPVFASRDQLEQVVVNLVDNAIKYTPSGGRVVVEAKAEGSYVAITVSDTGIGIEKKDLERIFERFYRVDKARSRESGGTGLGLSIVKNIVESHQGEVRVKSDLGAGTTFTILLPSEKPG